MNISDSTARFASRAIGRRFQRGVTLIEILITLLVLAVGLLGLAALQGVSLKTGQVSLYRTQATNLAYEVIDHARANRSQVAISGSIPNEAVFAQRIAALLPNGTLVTGVTDGGGDGIVNVQITWLDDREAEDADDQETTFEVESRI
tara:strand:- start:398 stop:838 length:441 start_codon:yes stop_codon:yes gene_type:complete